MTDDKLIEESFKTHEDAPTWDDDPVGRDSAIRWHMRGFNDAFAVFEKAYAPAVDSQFYEGLSAARRTPCIRSVPGSVIPCCGEPTGDYPDAEGQHALRHPDDGAGADD